MFPPTRSRRRVTGASPRKLRSRFIKSRLLRDQRGSVTIETVLWTPLIFGIIGLVADATLIYSANAQMWHVASDAARRMSVHELTDDGAPAFVRNALPAHLRDVAVVAAEADDDTAQLTISVPTSAMALIGIYAPLIDATATARVVMSVEGAQYPDFSALVGAVGAGAPAGGS